MRSNVMVLFKAVGVALLALVETVDCCFQECPLPYQFAFITRTSFRPRR